MAGIENNVLEHLRPMRGQLGRMEQRLEDAVLRPGHLEHAKAGNAVQLAEIYSKLNRLDARVTRIEKRLDRAGG